MSRVFFLFFKVMSHVVVGSDFLKMYNWYFGYLDELFTMQCH